MAIIRALTFQRASPERGDVDQVRRRRLLISSGALLLPPFVHAQQTPRQYRVGVFFIGGSDTIGLHREAIRERLAGQGFVEGRNLQIIWRGGIGRRHEDRQVARELVATQPDAILAFSSAMTQALQFTTKSIPIVFTHVSDPIADGVVRDYARPGGNTTGVSTRHRELLAKRFELLRELVPKARLVALVTPVVTDPSYAASEQLIRDIAAQLDFEVFQAQFARLFEIEEKRAEAMFVFFAASEGRLRTESVTALAAKLRVASIFPDAESVALGGLASYGPDLLEETRRGADQLARVLKGAKPGELAVDQSSRFTLTINLRSGRALGLTIPQSLLLRADQVIE